MSFRSTGAVLLAIALALGACTSEQNEGTDEPSPTATVSPSASPSAEPTGPRAGGSLRYALSTDPEYIDPGLVSDEQGEAVVDALFDSLVAFDQDLEVVPAAASDWDVNETATEFTFHLKQGATFHDGTPVTAGDFVRAFNRIADGTRDPLSFVAYQLAPVQGFEDAQATGEPMAGVQAVGEHTLRITLVEPFAEFPKVLADPSLAPVPARADEDREGFAERPVGNGPFQMAEPWQHGQFIRVARFPEYSGTPALLDEVVFQIYTGDGATQQQYSDFANGQLQFAEVPPADMEQAREEYGVSDDGYAGPGVIDGLTTTIYYYGFNLEAPPFDNPEVRRAISQLIDRETITSELMEDTRTPADAIVPPSVPGHQTGVCQFCTYDPEAATARLAEIELPETIRILHNTGPSHEAIARQIASDIESALGLQVERSSEDLQPFVETLRQGEMDLFRLGWQADYPSPGSYLFPLFHTSTVGQDNLTRYSNAEVDQQLRQARSTQDAEQRRQLFQQVERTVLDQAVIAPIMFYRYNRVVAPEVREFRIDPLGHVDLTKVWLEPEE